MAARPGPTRTEGAAAMGDALRQLAAQAPAGRPAAPEEIAEAIMFLRPTVPVSSRVRFCRSMAAEPPYKFLRPRRTAPPSTSQWAASSPMVPTHLPREVKLTTTSTRRFFCRRSGSSEPSDFAAASTLMTTARREVPNLLDGPNLRSKRGLYAAS